MESIGIDEQAWLLKIQESREVEIGKTKKS